MHVSFIFCKQCWFSWTNIDQFNLTVAGGLKDPNNLLWWDAFLFFQYLYVLLKSRNLIRQTQRSLIVTNYYNLAQVSNRVKTFLHFPAEYFSHKIIWGFWLRNLEWETEFNDFISHYFRVVNCMSP